MPKLKNEGHERYCQNYTAMAKPVTSTALIDAGYKEKYARQMGHNIHARDDVQVRLTELAEARNERLGIIDQQDRVIKELSHVGYSNIVDILIDIKEAGPATVESLKKLSKEQRSAIMEITFHEGAGGYIEKIKLHPKIASLKLIGEHEGMFKPERGSGLMFFMDADYGGVEGEEADD